MRTIRRIRGRVYLCLYY